MFSPNLKLISNKKKLPKGRCVSLAISRISIAFMLFLALGLILVIVGAVLSAVFSTPMVNDILTVVAVYGLIWLPLITVSRKVRFPFYVLLQLFFLGFLVYKLDTLGTSAGGIDNSDIGLNDTSNHADSVVDTSDSYIDNSSYSHDMPSFNDTAALL